MQAGLLKWRASRLEKSILLHHDLFIDTSNHWVFFVEIIFQDKNLSTGLFFLELLTAVEPRVVNWNLVTKGESGTVLFPQNHVIRISLCVQVA